MEKKKIVEYSICLQNVVQWKYRVGENRHTKVQVPQNDNKVQYFSACN